MLKKYVFIVVSALGNVGTELRSILETSDLPIKKLVPMDVPQNDGKKVRWRDEEYTVVEPKPEVVKRGCIVVDNSTAFRMAPEYPLVIPEVNADQLVNHQGIIANPNCSTIQMLVAIKPIHDKYRVKRLIVSTYQVVSCTGHTGVDELAETDYCIC